MAVVRLRLYTCLLFLIRSFFWSSRCSRETLGVYNFNEEWFHAPKGEFKEMAVKREQPRRQVFVLRFCVRVLTPCTSPGPHSSLQKQE